MKVHIIKPRDLSKNLIEEWLRLVNNDAAFNSPFFRPEFTQVVARVRDDAEVALFEIDGEVVGFFPFQRLKGHIGRPVGGKLSDCHGVIGQMDRMGTAPALLRACGLSTWDFNNLPVSQKNFEPFFSRIVDTAYIDLSDGYKAYEAYVNDSHRSSTKRAAGQYRKMEREIGPIQFKMHAADEGLIDQLFEWKSKQLRAMGVTNIFSYAWVIDILKKIFHYQSETFGCMLNALFAGDRVVALFFGIRSCTVLQGWVMAYDSAMAKYSPGTLLIFELIKAANRFGVQQINIGRADGWKTHFMNGTVAIAEGSVDLRPIRGPLRSGMRQIKEWLRDTPINTGLREPARIVSRIKNSFEFR